MLPADNTLATLPLLPTATVYETFLTLAAILTAVITVALRGRMRRPVDRMRFGVRLGFSVLTALVGIFAMLSPNAPPNVTNTLVVFTFALSQCGNLLMVAIDYAWETREPPATSVSEHEYRHGASEYRRGLDDGPKSAAQ